MKKYGALKSWCKAIIPPVLFDLFRAVKQKSGIRFEGPISDWETAEKLSTGYNKEEILQKTLNATMAVIKGEAKYERDSIAFSEIEYDWPVISTIMWTAAKNQGILRLLDFGGALGSSFFNYRRFLKELKEVHWNVVEQSHFVACGKSKIQNDQLKFFYSLEESCNDMIPDIILFGSALQYIPQPLSLFREICRLQPQTILLDRTYISDDNIDRIFIQKNPASIYDASYPCHFISEPDMLEIAEGMNFELIKSYDCFEFPGLEKKGARLKGYIFSKTSL
ncbi:MAG: TIGR04325 family methyltransferase [Candidatus Rifleibacteriota bacterium]